MATRTVVYSDLSGDELDDSNHARVQVKHPDNPAVLELDCSIEEADKLTNTTLRLIEFTIFAGDRAPRKALMETKAVDSLFKDFDKALEGARKAEPGRVAAVKKSAAKTGPGIDYSTPENAGKLHRGRITDAEAEWVRDNQDKASYNREQQTGKPIDFSDAAEQKRYGMVS